MTQLPIPLFPCSNGDLAFFTHSHVALPPVLPCFHSPISQCKFCYKFSLFCHRDLMLDSTNPSFPFPFPFSNFLSSMKISSSLDFRSNDAAAAGCLSGILRRFLCGNLRSNACREGAQGQGIDAGFCQERKTMPSPGIVARLMGLESMPVHPCASSELLGRSRSTNSLDSWPGFLSEMDYHSPQFRTSQSFREVPTYFTQENEEFLLLSFTPDDREETMASTRMKHQMDFREMKERKKSKRKARVETERIIREKKNRNKRVEQKHRHNENSPERKHGEVNRSRKKDVHSEGSHGTEAADSLKPMKQREMPIFLDKSSPAKKKLQIAQGKVQLECSSQNSSPVSVLDLAYIHDDSYIDTISPSPGELKQSIQQSSRRKLRSNDIENANCLSPSIGFVITFSRDGGMRLLDKERKRSMNQEQACQDFSDIWGKICRLAEEDLKKSTWISKGTSRPERVGDIAADLGLHILDLLLYEAVYELPNYITL